MREIDISNALILIVDDTPANLTVLSDALKTDYRVKIATSGQAALDILKKEKPTLVLLDVMMPGIDGFEVCRRIKQQQETSDIAVIFVTAKSDVVDQEEGLKLGAVDYITKPFFLPIVKTRVRIHVSLKLKSDLLDAMAHSDGLTGIPNRRRFNDALEVEWRRAIRTGTSISLILMDVDFFKLYNDNYGHGMGDTCLQQVASALAAAIARPSDFVARYGGEEFVALLPDTDAEGACLIAERMRSFVEALQLPHEHSSVSDWVTISAGVASMVPTGDDASQDLLKLADQMLYRAKESGRNRICRIDAIA
jgi:diguanylate cyclase (GGDEF)-like protein